MNVIMADEMGMCFGVRDALRTARDVSDPTQVTIHGELVHNDEVNRDLRARGFQITPEAARDGLPSTERVLITAHGISRRETDRLLAAGKTLIDATCPLVSRVHAVVDTLVKEGRFIVIVGQPGHVEVRGLVEDLDDCAVVADVDDVAHWPVARLGVVAQTTASPALVQAVMAQIRLRNASADVRFFDTVCRPTRMRQSAVENLLTRVDALVVVGGHASNNTRKLAQRASERGIPCQLVRNAGELDPDWCARFSVVGLTAGTSTPDETIDAVHQRLLQISPKPANPPPPPLPVACGSVREHAGAELSYAGKKAASPRCRRSLQS